MKSAPFKQIASIWSFFYQKKREKIRIFYGDFLSHSDCNFFFHNVFWLLELMMSEYKSLTIFFPRFFLCPSLVVSAFIPSSNCICLSWSLSRMVIWLIFSSYFCAWAVLTIKKIYGSRSELKPSLKKSFCSQLAKGFFISANLATLCFIDFQYLAMILNSDLVWQVIRETVLFEVAKLKPFYLLFQIFCILFRSSILLIWTRRSFSKFNRIIASTYKYLLSHSKKLSLFFFTFCLCISLVLFMTVMLLMIWPSARVQAGFWERNTCDMFEVIYFLILT